MPKYRVTVKGNTYASAIVEAANPKEAADAAIGLIEDKGVEQLSMAWTVHNAERMPDDEKVTQ